MAEITEITLPAHWVCALINGDYTDLDEEERVHVDNEIAKLAQAGWQIVGVANDDPPRFTWRYPLYHPGNPPSGGEVIDYLIRRIE